MRTPSINDSGMSHNLSTSWSRDLECSCGYKEGLGVGHCNPRSQKLSQHESPQMGPVMNLLDTAHTRGETVPPGIDSVQDMIRCSSASVSQGNELSASALDLTLRFIPLFRVSPRRSLILTSFEAVDTIRLFGSDMLCSSNRLALRSRSLPIPPWPLRRPGSYGLCGCI